MDKKNNYTRYVIRKESVTWAALVEDDYKSLHPNMESDFPITKISTHNGHPLGDSLTTQIQLNGKKMFVNFTSKSLETGDTITQGFDIHIQDAENLCYKILTMVLQSKYNELHYPEK